MRAARRAELGAISVTDHDDVRSFAEACEAGEEQGIQVLCGVEISSWRDGVDVHILGYGFDPEDARMAALLTAARNARVDRADRIVRRLGELGVPIAREAVDRIAGNAAIGRPHVARALVEAGHVPTIREAFERWLADGKPACVDKLRVTPEDAIATIQAAGGVAIAAHPITLGAPENCDPLVAAGLDGIEVRHGLHGESATAAFDRYAREHGLVRTGGSDFHGPRISSSEPGSVSIPKEWWDELLLAVARRRAAAGKPADPARR